MNSTNTLNIASEWSLLQDQFDSYEKHSLLIKFSSIGVLSAAHFTNHLSIFVLLLLLILWLQDAIWKTFQARIDARLLQLEGYLSNEHVLENRDCIAFQFNSLYAQNRPGNIGLLKEYLGQSLRPTVAFPHIVLITTLALHLFLIN